MATSINGAISNYTYTYQNKLQPKFDKNDDAVWSKDELTDYAKAYNKDTGKTLDVDSLMTKYANADGVIDYASQQKMKTDDALGLNALTAAMNAPKPTTTTPTTGTGTGTTGTATPAALTQAKKFDILNAVNSFSYEYNGKLQPKLDKDDDGLWSKDEVSNYATAYTKATGKKLDVDALMTKYGNDAGYINPTNQLKMKDADALGLSTLKTAYDSAKNTSVAPVGNKAPNVSSYERPSSDSFSLKDLLGSMSSSAKMNFSTSINKLDNNSALLNSFASGSSNMSSLLSSANSINMYKAAATGGNSGAVYAAMSGSLMNFSL